MNRFKRKKSERQYVWEYMRRNRIFKVEDLLPLTDMGTESLRKYFGQLERAGYIRARKIGGKVPRRFTERSYGLVKNTGILCPVWIEKQRRLFDRNEMKLQLKDGAMKLPVTVTKPSPMRKIDPVAYDMGRIEQLLASEPEGLTLLVLNERSGISPGRFAFVLMKMQQEGRVIETGKEGGVPVYALERSEHAG